MDDVTIRRARPGDLDDLVELGVEYCVADGHEVDEPTMRTGFAGLLGDDTYGLVLVALAGDAVVGYGVVTWGWSVEIGGLDVVLDELYVRTKNTGLGSRLVEAIEAECRARGVKRIFLETERPNVAARRLYARLGWTEDDSIWMSKELH